MSETNTEVLEQTAEAVEQAPETGKKRKRGKKDKPKKSPAREALEWVVTIVAALLIAMLVRTYAFELIRVDGHSMDFTLADGETMLVTKFDYLVGEPERFDVVICHYPGRTQTQLGFITTQLNFVKRVVGLPGDTVEVRDGFLYVNGEKYDEPYITNRPNYNMKPYTVPEGMYFVLGDNRSNSNDSHLIGPLDKSMIVGHVRCVLLPFDDKRVVKNGLEY